MKRKLKNKDIFETTFVTYVLAFPFSDKEWVVDIYYGCNEARVIMSEKEIRKIKYISNLEDINYGK